MDYLSRMPCGQHNQSLSTVRNSISARALLLATVRIIDSTWHWRKRCVAKQIVLAI